MFMLIKAYNLISARNSHSGTLYEETNVSGNNVSFEYNRTSDIINFTTSLSIHPPPQ